MGKTVNKLGYLTAKRTVYEMVYMVESLGIDNGENKLHSCMSGLHNMADHGAIGPRKFLSLAEKICMEGKTVKG